MADEDPKYLNWLRAKPCGVCEGIPPSHAHHHTDRGGRGARGKAQRAHDHDAMPLCWKCHRNFHDGTGRFAGWTRGERREFQDKLVALYFGLYTDEDLF